VDAIHVKQKGVSAPEFDFELDKGMPVAVAILVMLFARSPF
jgi:hypothetical protein